MNGVIPMLAEIELKTIQEISTTEGRALAKHKIPGMDGYVFQNLGRKPTKVMFSGILYGEKAKEDLEKLWTKFKAGEPVSFVADITTTTDISQVLIEDLKMNEVAGKPDQFRYSAVLRECPSPPPEKVNIKEEQEKEAEEIQKKKEEQVEEKVGTIEVRVELEEGETDYHGISVIVEGTSEDGEQFSMTVDKEENGIFTADNLPPGTYTATVISEGE